jgi:hypothetical protein
MEGRHATVAADFDIGVWRHAGGVPGANICAGGHPFFLRFGRLLHRLGGGGATFTFAGRDT